MPEGPKSGMNREARGVLMHVIRTCCLLSNQLSVYRRGGVSQCMKSVHAERHVDVGVSLYMRKRHASQHVDVRVSPHMRPEACGSTHSHSYDHFSLASHFYKYQATLHNFHSSHSIKSTPKLCLEREREKESGRLRV
ncbi:hypothetical protein YC2023_059267 [Brassica napus]